MTGAVVGGRRVSVRLLERGDESLIRRFYYRCSPDTVYRRFLSPVAPPADALVQRLIDVDHRDRDALIALDDNGIAGIARYAPAPGGHSYEVAIAVADDWQRKGLGRMLMRRLAHIARLRGIRSFQATILGDNRRAQAFVLSLSPQASIHVEAGLVEAEIPLSQC